MRPPALSPSISVLAIGLARQKLSLASPTAKRLTARTSENYRRQSLLLLEQILCFNTLRCATPRTVGSSANERAADPLLYPGDQAGVVPDPSRQAGAVIEGSVELTSVSDIRRRLAQRIVSVAESDISR
jgi:hypothetical protein